MAIQRIYPKPVTIQTVCTRCKGSGKVAQDITPAVRYRSRNPEFIAFVVKQRKDGLTYREIAEIPGVDYGQAVLREIMRRHLRGMPEKQALRNG